MATDIKTKILYVEDEYITRIDVKSMLSTKYKNILLAKDGNDGYKLFMSENPDVIITDIKMPVMDGIQMTEKIRAINKTVPIVVASAFDQEFVKFDNLNIFGYLTKPITKFSLLIMIENAILQSMNN